MRFCRFTILATVSLWIAVSLPPQAFSQEGTAALTGRVTDPSGLVVTKAKIQAVDVNTGITYLAETNNAGLYDFPILPPGSYRMVVDKEGFEQIVKPGVALHVSDIIAINFVLQIGSVTQSLTIESGAPMVETTNGSLGSLVDDQRITDLPLNGRNYVDLTLLQPGVTQQIYVSTTNIGLGGTEYSSNGAPWRSNSYLLDGALLQNQSEGNGGSITGTTLGVDGILEYRVITNNFSAEYGMSMGSIQTLVSKSGTNQFHGDTFEFLRNSSMDARNYFDLPPSTIGHRLPEFRRNNFGGALGGPILENRTFFFGVYEGLGQSLGTTNTANVLPAGCHGSAGQTITPASCPELSSPVTIAPPMAPLVALYPVPNVGTSEYGFPFTQPTSEHYGQIRVDQKISGTDNLFGRYTVDQAAQTSVYDLPLFGTGLFSRNQFLTLSENHNFWASFLNTFHFSFSRTNLEQELASSPTVSSPQYSFVAGEAMGNLLVNGLTTTGNSASPPILRLQNIFTWSDDTAYTRDRHSLKVGFIFNHFQWHNYSLGLLRGQAIFAGVSQFLTGNLAGGQGYTEDPPGSILVRHWHFDTMGLYAQDDWRVRPRLTLTLGMRYEPTTTYEEVHGISASIRNYLTDATTTIGPPFRNPSLRNISPRFGFAWDIFGNGRTALRGGFSILYDQTTLGTAVGIAGTYTPPFVPVVEVATGTFTIPFLVPANTGVTNTYRGPVYFQQQPHLLSYNLTAERQVSGSTTLTVAYAGSRGINLPQDKEGNPSIPNGIPSNGMCIAAPSGTVINPANQVDGQATSCYLAGAQRRNPNWGSLAIITAGGDSFYNALELTLNRRLSWGLQLQSAYTWSKLIDDSQSGSVGDDNGPNSVTGADPLHERTDRGPADFDLTQNWRVNAIYHFSSPRISGILGEFLTGWWLSGVYSLQSGYPMTVFLSSNRSEDAEIVGTPNPYERPDVVPGRYNSNITHGVSSGCGTGLVRSSGGTAIAAGTPLGTSMLWYDPCAFTTQPLGFLGTEGRNYLRGTEFDNLNFSIVKDTTLRSLGEDGKIEFRTEFFNLFNQHNFALPSGAGSTVSEGTCGGSILACGPSAQNPTSAAGTITATNGTSRQIQFGLKIIF